MNDAVIWTAAVLGLRVTLAGLAPRLPLDAHYLDGVARILISATLAGRTPVLIDEKCGLPIDGNTGLSVVTDIPRIDAANEAS